MPIGVVTASVPTKCARCSSTDILFRKKRGDWVCGECDHTWTGSGPESPTTGAGGVSVALRTAFVSYGHVDAPDFARRLRDDLAAAGCRVWLDIDEIMQGANWDVRIEAGVRSSDVLLAVMTSHSTREESICRDEIVLAHTQGKTIVPVRVTDDPSVRPTLLLVRRSWLDFSADYDQALATLLRYLSGDATALTQPAFNLVNGHVPFDPGPEIARHVSGFTGRDWLFAELDAWLVNPAGRAFVIVGGPGTGKSAIAAKLSQRSVDAAAVHFCWSRNARTLDPSEFVASVVGALSVRVPGYAEALAKCSPEVHRDDASGAFRELVVEPALNTPAPERPQLLIIDALDEAVLREGLTIADVVLTHANSLPSWLRIVATTRAESRVLDGLRLLSVFELDTERADNRADVAAFIAKRLAEPNLAKRVDGAATKVASRLEELAEGNFLYAKMALDALEEERLSPADMAKLSPGLTDYYTKAFKRDFPDPERYAVEQAPILRCLAAAFAPVPIVLLRSATGFDPEIFHRRLRRLRPFLRDEGEGEKRTVSLFHRSISDWLVDAERAGDYFCDVVAGHARFSDVLCADPLASEYAVRWLPRHLLTLRRWDQLVALLTDLTFLDAAWDANEHEVLRYWATIERESRLRATEAYREAVSRGRSGEARTALTRFMFKAGHLSEASVLLADLIAMHRETGDRLHLHACLGYQALILRARGDLDGAMALHKEQERICRELGDRTSLHACLGNQAVILYDRGDLDGAMALHQEEERICRELGIFAGLKASLGNQALILETRGDLDGAMALLKEQESGSRELGDPQGLQISLGNQANILKARGDLDGAMALHQEEERICRELGDPAGLRVSLGSQANILQVRGDLDGAMALHQEEERICRELGDPVGLQFSLGNQALILKARGDLDGAMKLLKEEERVCRELGISAGLKFSLGSQASILRARGDLDGAMALHKEQERICRELGDPASLKASLGDQALILHDRGDLDGAMALHQEEERICRELGEPAGLQISLGNQALILYDRGDLDGAWVLHKEQEHICRAIGAPAGLQVSLCNQANILHARGDLDGAMALLKEQERICRELGDPLGLAVGLRNSAECLLHAGRPSEALSLIEESVEIARRLGSKTIESRLTLLEQIRAALPSKSLDA